MGAGERIAWVTWTAVALAAAPAGAGGQDARAWCPEPEARQFDFWLGEWDVANYNSPPTDDRWFHTGDATNRVYAVVGGCAVVEHWRGYAFPSAGHIVGFSVRAWDPASRRWDLVLLWPIAGPPAFGNPRGRFEDGRGDFFNQVVNADGDTVRTRLSFYDIGPDAFTWSNGASTDGGESWSSSWRMEFARRPATATGLWNGTSVGTERCPGAGHRTFDGHLGEWRGTRVDAAGDTSAVRTHLVPILQGCAVMERTWAEDGSREAFRVRAFEPGAGGWAEYGYASDRRRLARRDAPPSGDLVFTETEATDGTYARTRWTLGDGTIARVEEAAPSRDGPWRRVAETRFTERVGG